MGLVPQRFNIYEEEGDLVEGRWDGLVDGKAKAWCLCNE